MRDLLKGLVEFRVSRAHSPICTSAQVPFLVSQKLIIHLETFKLQEGSECYVVENAKFMPCLPFLPGAYSRTYMLPP